MFPELVKKFQAEMQYVDTDVHVLLKGHLLIEEILTEIIETFLFEPKYFLEAKFGFYHKLMIARSLCLRKDQCGEWDLLLAINSLRNELAHKLDSPKRQNAIKKVKDLYFREAAAYPDIEKIKKQDDHIILLNACTHCAGFLSSFAEDARSLRRVIHDIDRKLNSELPAFDPQ